MSNHHFPNRAKLSVAALMVILSQPANAGSEETEPSMFSFGGFGTLGVVHSSESKADFAKSALDPNGAGFSRSWSASVDSLIAAQASANLTPKLSAVLQVISKQNYNNTYWPQVEWADIKYKFTPDLSLRVGRIVLPSFLVADTRNVGYANTWVRPPVEMYSLIPIDSSDGVDASYGLHIGNGLQTLVASYGNTSSRIPNLGSAKSKRNWLVADTIEYGPATLHIAYQQSHVTIDYLAPLFDGYQNFGPQGTALAAKYDPENKLLTFFALGGIYDPGQWFVMGEWGTVDFHSVLGKKTAWYASSGYRLGKFTPYLTYAQAKSGNFSDPGLTVTALPPYLQAPASALNGALNQVLSSKPVQSSISLGARWDFMKNMDIKLQFDRLRLGPASSGVLINVQPDFQRGSKVDLFSATVDFVF